MDNGASSYRRFLNGDDSGFVELVRDYKDGLIFYLDSFTRNIHIAEELMQDTLAKLAIKRPRYTDKAPFKTWLYTIARNVALDELRKLKKVNTTALEEVENYLPDEASGPGNGYRWCRRIEKRQRNGESKIKTIYNPGGCQMAASCFF